MSLDTTMVSRSRADGLILVRRASRTPYGHPGLNRGHVLVGSVCAQHIAESTAPGGTVDVVPIKTRISDPDVQSTQRVCPCARGVSVRDRVARSPVSLSVHGGAGIAEWRKS